MDNNNILLMNIAHIIITLSYIEFLIRVNFHGTLMPVDVETESENWNFLKYGIYIESGNTLCNRYPYCTRYYRTLNGKLMII